MSRRFAVGDAGLPPAAAFFCGAYRFEGDLYDGLLGALPDTLWLRPASGSTLRATMELLARESSRRAGPADPPGPAARRGAGARSSGSTSPRSGRMRRAGSERPRTPESARLADWRMALARERLRDTDAGLATIEQALGYASEFSFAAAFKRHHGTAPGRWRRKTSPLALDVATAETAQSRSLTVI